MFKCRKTAMLATNLHLYQDNPYRYGDGPPKMACKHCRRLVEKPRCVWEDCSGIKGTFMLYNRFGQLEYVFPHGIAKPICQNADVALQLFQGEIEALANRTRASQRIIFLDEFDTVPGGYCKRESYGMKHPFACHHESACEAICKRMTGCTGFESTPNAEDPEGGVVCTFKATPGHILRDRAVTTGHHALSTLHIRRINIENVILGEMGTSEVPPEPHHASMKRNTQATNAWFSSDVMIKIINPVIGLACIVLVLFWYFTGRKVLRPRRNWLQNDQGGEHVLLLNEPEGDEECVE
eukprot:GEMP01027642.1.p1 GENE.GEMP01027642.1~~GEMP01027642.1.p1  ORF type:complete len:295 (+),score=45.37 GEMP01027642.1:325-1209(+)